MLAAGLFALVFTSFVLLPPDNIVIWERPSDPVLTGQPARAPKPPYRFERVLSNGTSPKIIVSDARGSRWIVKGGHEVHAEVFATRFVRSLGFYADELFFVPQGKIEGAKDLGRLSWFVKPDGGFITASFELIQPDMDFLENRTWPWSDPFLVRKREFRALKTVVMLLSNWDNKDARNTFFGSNTGVLRRADGTLIYYVTDWGESMGSWGRWFGLDDWNCTKYTRQTPSFVKGISGGRVKFGFRGQHTGDFKHDILVSDVSWLLQQLDRISDGAIRDGLRFAGASSDEVECFSKALRNRIEQLRSATRRN